MRIVGINNGHDPSCAALVDGAVACFIEEERLTRVKHGVSLGEHGAAMATPRSTFPHSALAYCLDATGLGIDDVDLVVVANRDRWIAGRIPIRDKGRVRFLPEGGHHLAHALSAFYASPFDSAAVLVADHSGSVFDLAERIAGQPRPVPLDELVERWFRFRPSDGARLPGPRSFAYEAESGWMASSRAVGPESVFRNLYPLEEAGWHGLGGMYAATCRALGLVSRATGMDEAGTLMALASYASPGRPLPWQVGLRDAGALDFSGLRPALAAAHRQVRAAGPLSRAEGFAAAAELARVVQENLERALLHLARQLRRTTGASRLCIGGGVGLNVPANRLIRDTAGFDEVFVLPACHDGGNALGAAYWGLRALAGAGSAARPVTSYYLGRRHTRPPASPPAAAYVDDSALVARAARLLADGRTVGWFQGGSEAGPRALGNRSILADPRPGWMRDHLNAVVKLREPYRPFAPLVTEEAAGRWFDLDRSPHMLLAARVLPGRAAEVPAVVHVDGTARVQTVSREQNPLLHDLVTEFGRLTGVPVLLNTSFNGPGEPLVETPEDAIACFSRLDLDVLFIEHTEHGRQAPEQVRLAAVPGWERVLPDVLATERTGRFLDHVAARAEVARGDVADAIAEALGALGPAGLGPAGLGPAGLADTPVLRAMADASRRYVLGRLFFLLRREGLATVPVARNDVREHSRPPAVPARSRQPGTGSTREPSIARSGPPTATG